MHGLRPEVHRTFLIWQVPHEVSEIVFWKRYFRSKSARANAALSSNSDRASDSAGAEAEAEAASSEAMTRALNEGKKRGRATEPLKYPDTNVAADHASPWASLSGSGGCAPPISPKSPPRLRYISAVPALWQVRASELSPS